MPPPLRNELETQIRHLLIEYHSIFKTRGEVLDHMYFVLGNGYDWKEGKLVEKFQDHDTNDFLHMVGPLTQQRYIREKELARQEVNQRAQDPTIRCPYPVSKLVPFFNVPDNVKEPYLRGALEIGQLRQAIREDSRIAEQLEKLHDMLEDRIIVQSGCLPRLIEKAKQQKI